MLRFYDVALSPFAQKVKIALLEKGLDYQTETVNLSAAGDGFTAASPRREVPALEDEGVAIFDSSIILEYLEEKHPRPPLLPTGAAERARVRMLEEVCDTQFEAVNWGLTEIVVFRRAEGDRAQAMLGHAAKEIGQLKAWLTGQLGSRPWFNGEAFGYGDIAVFPYLQTASLYKQGPDAGSPLAGWLDRARARASVQQTVDEAKAAVAAFRDLGQKIMSGESPRQYRDHRLEFMLRAGGLDIVAQGMAKGTIKFSTIPGQESAPAAA
jgi:glutathione S-transferase/RNA polymerase-associated protein